MKEKFLANSLYVHFPFCRHLCNYCDFFKRVPQSQREVVDFHALLELQKKQLDQILLNENFSIGKLNSLYFGGGTPSLWGEPGAAFWKQFTELHQITLADSCEFTMELNPGSWKKSDLDHWKALGLNRISMGMQSLDQRFIKILDRVHNREDALETLEMLKNSKMNFSVDFMLGLPHSKDFKRDILGELNEVLKYNPSHLSLYILTVKSNYVHQKDIPDEEYIEKEYLTVSKFLKEHGFEHYEVSNFAKPGFRSFHNSQYWKQESTLALGPSATGFLKESKIRFKWKESDQPDIENLNDEELKLEKLFLQLRTDEGLSIDDFSVELRPAFLKLAQNWQEDRQLGEWQRGRFRLGAKGYLVMDSLLNELMAHNLA